MLGQTESKKSSFKLPCPSSDVSFLAFLSSCCWLVVFALVAPFYLTRYLLHNAPYVPCLAKGIYNYKTFYFVELSTTGISWWKHRRWVNHKEDSCRKTSKTDFRYLYWAALTFVSSVVRKLQGWFFPFFFSLFLFFFFFLRRLRQWMSLTLSVGMAGRKWSCNSIERSCPASFQQILGMQ